MWQTVHQNKYPTDKTSDQLKRMNTKSMWQIGQTSCWWVKLWGNTIGIWCKSRRASMVIINALQIHTLKQQQKPSDNTTAWSAPCSTDPLLKPCRNGLGQHHSPLYNLRSYAAKMVSTFHLLFPLYSCSKGCFSSCLETALTSIVHRAETASLSLSLLRSL